MKTMKKNPTNQKPLEIGDAFEYKSTDVNIDSFVFTIFQINVDNVDVIINNSQHRKIKLAEFGNPNLVKLHN